MSAYPSHPQVGVGVVLLRGEEVLLVRRGKPPGEGAWSLPGGRQELGETAEDCARRELMEETGLACGPLMLVGHADSINHDAAGRIEYHYTILDFGAHYVAGTAIPGDDVTDVAWVAPRAFDDYGLWDEARRMISRTVSALRP